MMQPMWRGTRSDCLRQSSKWCGRREAAASSSTQTHSIGMRRKEVGLGEGRRWVYGKEVGVGKGRRWVSGKEGSGCRGRKEVGVGEGRRWV